MRVPAISPGPRRSAKARAFRNSVDYFVGVTFAPARART
jgi:hypothetical protein